MRFVVPNLKYLACAAGLVLGSGSVSAVTSTANLDVKITITNECTVAQATPVDFSSHGVLNTQFPATGGLSVTCTSGAPFSIGMGPGTGPSATIVTRQMTNGGNVVAYQLFRDTGHTLTWGDLASGNVFTGTGTGSAVPVPVYGLTLVQTTPPAGNYADSVVVTISY